MRDVDIDLPDSTRFLDAYAHWKRNPWADSHPRSGDLDVERVCKLIVGDERYSLRVKFDWLAARLPNRRIVDAFLSDPTTY